MFDFFGEMYSDYGWWAMLLSIVLILALVFGLLCLEAWCLMALWNSCAVPAVSVICEIGFWQAWGISILSNILFKTVIPNKKKD